MQHFIDPGIDWQHEAPRQLLWFPWEQIEGKILVIIKSKQSVLYSPPQERAFTIYKAINRTKRTNGGVVQQKPFVRVLKY